ncbi:hypothetical protein CLAFUW4_13985 [Fulvia fulva]|nr:hypothetical protein CLAFUR4_13988 [Fulvia fulva]KAK4610868.1 hypothetical protein CLAFUR0_13992 [Fulvia fulva]WPV21833.1 hypothetical protein CLAFUW4_13985 [Fulvia fulva]
MANEQTLSLQGEAQSKTSKYHLLALPAELRLCIYDHYFADCIPNSTNKDGSALLEVCRTIRIEATPECEKHMTTQLGILDRQFVASTEHYLNIRARWASGTHPIFLSGMILVRENLDRISRRKCALIKMQGDIRQVWEREKAEDAFSLMVLEEKGSERLPWA